VKGEHGFTVRKYNVGENVPYQTINGHPHSEFSINLNMDVVDTDVELEGVLAVTITATYYMALTGVGPSEFPINDKVIYELEESGPDPMGFLLGGVSAPLVEYVMEAGK
jgi:beta-glucosidase